MSDKIDIKSPQTFPYVIIKAAGFTAGVPGPEFSSDLYSD